MIQRAIRMTELNQPIGETMEFLALLAILLIARFVYAHTAPHGSVVRVIPFECRQCTATSMGGHVICRCGAKSPHIYGPIQPWVWRSRHKREITKARENKRAIATSSPPVVKPYACVDDLKMLTENDIRFLMMMSGATFGPSMRVITPSGLKLTGD